MSVTVGYMNSRYISGDIFERGTVDEMGGLSHTCDIFGTNMWYVFYMIVVWQRRKGLQKTTRQSQSKHGSEQSEYRIMFVISINLQR